ncbi:MAG TPA: diacylglycerol kinase [Sphingomicrobium sp.]|nr:diacylglycerol kinase [Sphingomicrobium sp.]
MSELKDRALLHRLRNGLAGLAQGWKRERSLRTQLIVSGAGVLMLLIAHVKPAWLLVVLALLAVALAAELVNAAFEALIDRLHPDYDAEIGAVKDMSSAAVLVVNLAAGAAFVIALFASLA